MIGRRVAAVLVATGILVGCTSGKSGPTPTPVPAAAPPRIACRTELPKEWNEALRSHYLRNSVAGVRAIELVHSKGVLVSEEGSTGGASAVNKALWWYSQDFSRRTKVLELSGERSDDQVFSVSADEDMIAFALLRTHFTYDNWELWVWRPGGEKAPEVIAESQFLPDGSAIVSPQVKPHVHGGVVSWLQATVSDPANTTVFQYDTATGVRRMVRSSPARSLSGSGSTLMLADASPDSDYSRLLLLDAATGQLLSTPAPLSSVRGVGYPVAMDDGFAWVDADENLTVWQPGMSSPLVVLKARSIIDSGDDSRPIQFLGAAGPLLVFNNNGEGFVLDRRTWSFASLGGGFPLAQGGYFWLTPHSAMNLDKSQTVPVGSHFAAAADLPALPGCSR